MTDFATIEAGYAGGENQAIIDVATRAATAQELEPGIFLDSDNKLVDIRAEIHAERSRQPDRKAGTYKVTDAASFVSYLSKHGMPHTELWANVDSGTVRAVINAHDIVMAGVGDHTATLQLTTTDDWKDWTARDGDLSGQAAFAEFIEDHLPNFVSPTAADMLELAQTFQATTKVDFASSHRLKSGGTSLVYQEASETKAGAKGQLAVPDTFTIALIPFEGGPAYKVEARFRYRINGGQLALGYRLTRAKEVRKGAFDEVVDRIANDTERTIWATS